MAYDVIKVKQTAGTYTRQWQCSNDNVSIIKDNSGESWTWNDITFYNSAILHFGNNFFGFLLFSGSCTVDKYGGGSWQDQYGYTNDAGSNIYGCIPQNFTTATLDGVTIYYNFGIQENINGYDFETCLPPIFDNPSDFMAYITSPSITYQWSSVPAISGKNGILLPLSTLNDINNGEEVTTSDTSKFNLTGASNVAKLVGNIINAQG